MRRAVPENKNQALVSGENFEGHELDGVVRCEIHLLKLYRRGEECNEEH